MFDRRFKDPAAIRVGRTSESIRGGGGARVLVIYGSPRRNLLLAAVSARRHALPFRSWPLVATWHGSRARSALDKCANALCRLLERAIERRPIVRIDGRRPRRRERNERLVPGRTFTEAEA
jgi:hypothetical protein